MLEGIDGTFLTGLIGYAINGFGQAYPEVRPIIDAEVNEAGSAMLDDVAGQCVGETALRYGFHQTRDYTRTGEPLSLILDRYDVVQDVLAEQRLGTLRPSVPVLVQVGTADDIVPAHQVRQLVRDWCARGATVQLSENALPPVLPGVAVNHAVPYVAGIGESIEFVRNQFAGMPAPNSC